MASETAKQMLKRQEGKGEKGFPLQAYKDTEGVLTIGYGFNLSERDARETLLLAGVPSGDLDAVMENRGKALTEEQANSLFEMSLFRAELDAARYYKGFATLPQPVKDVVVNMSYNLGLTRLNKFKDMRVALLKEDWAGVQREMKDSKWWGQVKGRGPELASLVKGVEQNSPSPLVEEDNVGPTESAETQYAETVDDGLAQELAGMLPSDSLAQELAGMLPQEPVEQEKTTPAEPAKPKLQKLEQGLFEDETGKKFFVDEFERLLELGDDNQPKVVVDPSQFDFTKVQQDTSPTPIEEEIF